MIATEAEADLIVAADADDVTKENNSNKDKKSSKPKDRLETYIELMEAEDLYELEISDGPFQLKLVRESKHQPRMAMPMPAAQYEDAEAPAAKEAEAAPAGNSIVAPLGGVFYRSPSPKSPAFVKEGDRIAVGQTLAIIEAMKVMNEIKAEISGRVVKILIENGKPVDANQPMMIIEE